MIVLVILKIIGIILGSIVGLALLLVLLLCLAPVTYKVSANGENENIHADAKVRWLFGIFSINVEYKNGKLSNIGRILWIKLFGSEEDSKTESDSKTKSEAKEQLDSGSRKVLVGDKVAIIKEKKPSELSTKEIARKTEPIKKEKKQTSKKQNIKKQTAKKKKNFSEKWEELKEKYEKVKKLVSAQTIKRAVICLKRQIFRLLNHIKPRVIKGRAEFGTGSPDNTAIIYGVTANIVGIIDHRTIIIPNLEEKMLDLDLVIKGRLFIGFVLILFLKVLTNRDISIVRRYLKRNFSKKKTQSKK